MVIVAVAGGKGSVGKTIVDAIVKAQKHEVVVLTRKLSEGGTSSAPEYIVDYMNVEQVAGVLESNKIYTIISTIAVMDEATGESERALVAAAAKSAFTKRFVASNWGGIIPSDESLRIPFQVSRIKTIEALKSTNLEWTSFQNRYFLDYYGMPHVETNLKSLAFVLDVTNKAASIPGTGHETMTFTYTKDLGKFVNASLDLPRWSYPMVCYSRKTTWNNALKIAEEVRGTKFKVAYDPVDKLRKGEITELPFHTNIYSHVPKSLIQGIQSKFGLYVVYGLFDMPQEGSLSKSFPEIKTTSVEEIIGLWKLAGFQWSSTGIELVQTLDSILHTGLHIQGKVDDSIGTSTQDVHQLQFITKESS